MTLVKIFSEVANAIVSCAGGVLSTPGEQLPQILRQAPETFLRIDTLLRKLSPLTTEELSFLQYLSRTLN